MKRMPAMIKVGLTSLLFFLLSCSTVRNVQDSRSDEAPKADMIQKWMGHHKDLVLKMKKAETAEALELLSLDAREAREAAEKEARFWFSLGEISSEEYNSIAREIQIARGEEMVAYFDSTSRLGVKYTEER